MSHFLYIHKDLSNVDGVWKVGVAMTPYSAVRARQKFCWNKFQLDYLYFGLPWDIRRLENAVKYNFYRYSGKCAQGTSANTEMFKVDIDVLLNEIANIITEKKLKVLRVQLPKPYSAAKSGDCPFKIPSERHAGGWLHSRALDIFNTDTFKTS
jgi:hypothetical protein